MLSTNEHFLKCICRTCMHELVEGNPNTDQQWQSIFSTIEECKAVPIAELLSNTIPKLEVQLNDDLPKKMCSSCLEQLLSANRFQQMCIQSDQQMRLLIATKIKTTKSPGRRKTGEPEFTCEAIKNRIECEPANTLAEQQPNAVIAADPLQTMDLVMECFKDEPKDENEPHADPDEHIEYCDDGALHPKVFATDTVLKVEIESHKKLALKRIVCDTCGKTFSKPSSLRTHTRKYHSTEKPKTSLRQPLICELCNKTCSTRYKLAKHKKLQHSTEKQEPHPCDHCDKSFESRKALKGHLRTHKDNRPYLCPECGKSFSQAGNMRQHMLRHGDDKLFECPYCPSKFRCPNDVANHKIIHEGVKRHICDICGYSFGKTNQLAMHIRYHNKIKPYKCDCCEMRFPRMSAQRRHMRTHTGEKPYKCKYCGRAFAQTNDHMKHLRIHLGENVYRCKLCPLAFPSGKEMRLHYATHKNEDSDTRERNMKALEAEEAKLQLKFAESAK